MFFVSTQLSPDMFSSNELQALLADYAAKHPFPERPSGLYEPCTYMLALGGKRLRPLLALMGCQLFTDEVQRALPVAWAVDSSTTSPLFTTTSWMLRRFGEGNPLSIRVGM